MHSHGVLSSPVSDWDFVLVWSDATRPPRRLSISGVQPLARAVVASVQTAFLTATLPRSHGGLTPKSDCDPNSRFSGDIAPRIGRGTASVGDDGNAILVSRAPITKEVAGGATGEVIRCFSDTEHCS